jgi:hypothetical protein
MCTKEREGYLYMDMQMETAVEACLVNMVGWDRHLLGKGDRM